MAKALLPNQCDLLHQFYSPQECCICKAELRIKELEDKVKELEEKILIEIPAKE